MVLDNIDVVHLPEINDSDKFDDVAEGLHKLAAFYMDKENNETEIETIEIFISNRKDYSWDIKTCNPD